MIKTSLCYIHLVPLIDPSMCKNNSPTHGFLTDCCYTLHVKGLLVICFGFGPVFCCLIKSYLFSRKPSSILVFQAFQDQMACRECLAFRGRKVHREGMELKDRLVTREHKECRVQKESEVLKGLVERAGHQE